MTTTQPARDIDGLSPDEQALADQLEAIGTDDCARYHNLQRWSWVTDHCPSCNLARHRWKRLVGAHAESHRP